MARALQAMQWAMLKLKNSCSEGPSIISRNSIDVHGAVFAFSTQKFKGPKSEIQFLFTVDRQYFLNCWFVFQPRTDFWVVTNVIGELPTVQHFLFSDSF